MLAQIDASCPAFPGGIGEAYRDVAGLTNPSDKWQYKECRLSDQSLDPPGV